MPKVSTLLRTFHSSSQAKQCNPTTALHIQRVGRSACLWWWWWWYLARSVPLSPPATFLHANHSVT